ncbi:hypothetical protein BJV74DRAFT_839630 [Russula compacta]|nr:hypothetical protein BJV74DRAFT_839630 [Russula compacta]
MNTTFPYRWLRDACRCPSCIHPSTQQKLHRTSDIPASIAPESVETTDDGIHISWAGADGHRSFFPKASLAVHANAIALRSHHNDVPTTPWPTASALLAASGGDLEVPYDDLATPRGLLRAITQLQRMGILFLRGVSCTDKSDSDCEVRKLAARFAEIRDTFYGAVWNVKNAVSSRNIAYTNLFLGLHMDLQYFESPPRFQILHCLRNSTYGGTSLFVDAFAAAEALPTTPVPFQYRHTTPLFEREPRDDDDGGRTGTEPPPTRVTAVNYSPPFQAPLPRDTPREFYDALARFAALVDAPAAVYARLLGEGDAVVFDNRRILHGRTAFEDATKEGKAKDGTGEVGDEESNRWLKGCYFEGDIMASHGRILRARMARGEI